MFAKIKYLLTNKVVPHNVRALNNELNITLVAFYFVITTQYQWFIDSKSLLRLRLDCFTYVSNLVIAVYYLFTPSSLDINSVFVGQGFDVSQRINGTMFNHSFSY